MNIPFGVHSKIMRGRFAAFLLFLLGFACVTASAQPREKELILLTTTTTQDSGILQALTDRFERLNGIKVRTIVAGSGDILKQGARGEGDVLLTHSPQAEKEWMQQGYGLSRTLVMYNDFIIIGPPNDPAAIKGRKTAEALQRIAQQQAPFVSRGDQSGTHVKELALWKRAHLNPKGQPWYRETGQGQGLTMEVASTLGGYAFTDRGTYMVHERRLGLPILVEGDPALYNIYHVMPVNPAKFPKVNAAAAKAFADFLLSPNGQKLIADFGKDRFGRSLFAPAAGKNEEELLAQ